LSLRSLWLQGNTLADLYSSQLDELRIFLVHADRVRGILRTMIRFASTASTNVTQSGAIYQAVFSYKLLLNLVGKCSRTRGVDHLNKVPYLSADIQSL
jgi:hypothetical protein